MLPTWSIMPHSKPNSSPSFGLRTKKGKPLTRVRIEFLELDHRLLTYWEVGHEWAFILLLGTVLCPRIALSGTQLQIGGKKLQYLWTFWFFQGSDRNNIVEAIDPIDNYPLPWEMCKLFKNAIAVWSSLDFKAPKPEDIAVSLATAGNWDLVCFNPRMTWDQPTNPAIRGHRARVHVPTIYARAGSIFERNYGAVSVAGGGGGFTFC